MSSPRGSVGASARNAVLRFPVPVSVTTCMPTLMRCGIIGILVLQNPMAQLLSLMHGGDSVGADEGRRVERV